MPRGTAHGWGIAGSYLSAEIAKLPPVGGVTLHCISGHDFRPYDASETNRINIGYCFFEHNLLAHGYIAEAARQWDHIVAGSSWCEELLRLGGMQRTSTILQGIDQSRFSSQPPRSNDGRFIVFSGGKFEFRKGQDIVIAAMRIFMERHKDVWLSCSWHNQWPASIKTMEQTGLIDFRWRETSCNELLHETILRNGLDPARVLLHPPFENSRMPLIYAESDIGLFPNRCEGGNNMVMCEYMACGRTVIASSRTGHADVITSGNAFCLSDYHPVTAYIGGSASGIWPEPSVEEVLDQLEAAYTDRHLISAKAAVASQDMSRLTWGDAARQFLELAGQLAASGAGFGKSAQPAETPDRETADCLFEAGNYEGAEACYRNLLNTSPFSTDLLNSLATALDRQRRFTEALGYYNKALTLQPGLHAVRFNLANTLARAGFIDEAITELHAVVSAEPGFVEAWQNLGQYYRQKNQLQEAIDCLYRLTTLQPDVLDTWSELAVLHEERREFHTAVSCLETALAITPGDVGILNARGLLLHELGDLDGAERSFQIALDLDPYNPIICNNLGNICKSRLMFSEAIAWYDRALAIDQNNATIIFNRSLAFMALGDLLAGWDGFERRFKMIPPVVLPHPEIPRWDGGALHGRRLLIQCEQVYGDSFMFARFVAHAALMGGPVVLECQDRSVLKALRGLRGFVKAMVTRADPLPAVDVRIPLLSLPRVFGISIDTIPGAAGYLSADPERAAFWKDIIEPSDTQLKVGLVWGGRKAPLNADRSLPLRTLEPLLQLPGIHFYSLQQGDDALQSSNYASITDLGGQLPDFGETAAAIANLDLVITIDTAVAHLAGALGVPVWVMLKFSPDWRWLLDRNDSPWYASARLFRQTAPGDWDSVAVALKTALENVLCP